MNYKPAFQFYGGTEWADQKKMDWPAHYWGAWIKLKAYLWSQSDHQGKAINNPRQLKIAAGWPENRPDSEWKSVLSFFKVEGKYLVDPDLIRQLKGMKSFSEKQADKAKNRWAKAKSAQAPQAPAPAKPAATGPADGARSADGKQIAWKGIWWFPSQLEKKKAEAAAALAKAKNTKPDKSSRFFETAAREYNIQNERLTEELKSLQLALGETPSARFTPIKINSAREDSSPDLSRVFLFSGEHPFQEVDITRLQTLLAETNEIIAIQEQKKGKWDQEFYYGRRETLFREIKKRAAAGANPVPA